MESCRGLRTALLYLNTDEIYDRFVLYYCILIWDNACRKLQTPQEGLLPPTSHALNQLTV